MQKISKSVLFICPYPIGRSPSQRFRFEQYLELLTHNNFEFRLSSFFSLDWSPLDGKNALSAIMSLINGYFKRWLLLFSIGRYQYIFIHREVAPLGPPLFEWLMVKFSSAKLIYDFDDAIWLTDNLEESNFIRLVRWRIKVASICKWSSIISCGNEYLANYARNFNTSVVVNPTTIDIDGIKSEKIRTSSNQGVNEITIGWTGSHSTLKYLNQIEAVIRQLQNSNPNIKLLVIANKKPDLKISNFEFRMWSKATEIEDLMNISIGIMPLPDNDWTKGKCGFKILQYMALGIPCIASNVGVNQQIIQHGINGYLCSTVEEWVHYFHLLISNPSLREEIGQNGKKTVRDHYSVAANSDNFLRLFL